MGLKEWWEKQQTAIAFAEAGEAATARAIMDEETPGPVAKERSSYVSAYLPKPFRFEALRALIESLQLTPAPAE